MRLIEGILRAKLEAGKVVLQLSEGFEIMHGPRFAYVLVGRRNKAQKRPFFIPVGVELLKRLPLTEYPCPNDGNPTLGHCPICKVEITEDKVTTRIVGKQLVNGIETDVVEKTAKHGTLWRAARVKRGTFIFSKEKDTLILVEEFRKEPDRVALLLLAEGGERGGVFIEPPLKEDAFREKVHERARGERWRSPNGKLGINYERLLIFKEKDSVRVNRSGELRGAPDSVLITLEEVKDDSVTFSVAAVDKPLAPSQVTLSFSSSGEPTLKGAVKAPETTSV